MRGPRVCGQISSVDRRAAGRVRDLQAVAEELRQELQIRRLAAAGTRPGILEQRLHELNAAHVREIHACAVRPWQCFEERYAGTLAFEVFEARSHVDRLDSVVMRRMSRAVLDAHAAAGAI